MNQKIKAKWVAALRSNEFKQTKGALQDADGGFCCLGVLCELYSVANNVPWVPDTVSSFCEPPTYGDLSFLGSHSLLPTEVMLWAGLDSNDPLVTERETEVNLTELNDTGSSFDDIADLIEKSL